jgi:hypothetical protein
MTDQPQPDPTRDHGTRTGDTAGAARSAYSRRTAQRARRRRAETQAMRHERERLALAHQLRRELQTLAQGAADLARQAQGNGKAAEQAATRLASRRARAREALTQADRFALDPGLAELEPPDRAALELPDS